MSDAYAALIGELLALTGESASALHTWLDGNPALGSRPTTRTAFSNKWKGLASPMREQTSDCNLGSRPVACRLRFRALRFAIVPPKAGQQQRRFVLLGAYEPCTRFLWLGLAEDHSLGGTPIGVSLLDFKNFCCDVAERVGLPIARLIFTNRFVLDDDGQVLEERALREQIRAEMDDGSDPRAVIEARVDLAADYPAAVIGSGLALAQLVKELNRFVNHHNRQHALQRVQLGRETLRRMAAVAQPEKGKPLVLGKSNRYGRLMLNQSVKNAVELGRIELRLSVSKRR